jgi:carbon storage regulator
MIGDDIEVVIVDIRGDKVRLGITAPKEISVHRKEVYDQIKAENQAASTMQAGDLPSTVPPGNAQARDKGSGGRNRRSSQSHGR